MIWKVEFSVPWTMGVRAVNGKFEMMESEAVMVVIMKTQKLGYGAFLVGVFEPHRRLGEKGRLFRSIDELYK